ncbi:hypothetical protein [Curtobacterium sp. MCPF17_052]|uniref:hypothetical protein n=1 Tax=Curtobacterium sp. MCPF17_052 TaxID=2175655 RepID=UPI0024DF51A4|nr:hypothetical protein [Curtobacterium sp. MCPF17_052]WIB11421.1 hypothetical protein DEJ36_10365 [Curtobacterium sp. MCPF17_052]
MTATLERPTTRPASARGRRPMRSRAVRHLKRLPVYLIVAVLLVVFVYPLVWLFLGSLKTQDEFLNDPTWSLPRNWLNFSNYTDAWSSVALYLRNSVLAVVPALLITIAIGTAAGFALEVMVWKGRGRVLLLFLVGILIPRTDDPAAPVHGLLQDRTLFEPVAAHHHLHGDGPAAHRFHDGDVLPIGPA